MVTNERKQTRNPTNVTNETTAVKKPTKCLLVYKKFSQTSTIHPGILRGRALWADGVSPQINTIVSCDQFKPISIGKNLVANYNG